MNQDFVIYNVKILDKDRDELNEYLETNFGERGKDWFHGRRQHRKEYDYHVKLTFTAKANKNKMLLLQLRYQCQLHGWTTRVDYEDDSSSLVELPASLFTVQD
jgi:hypothetical protein